MSSSALLGLTARGLGSSFLSYHIHTGRRSGEDGEQEVMLRGPGWD